MVGSSDWLTGAYMVTSWSMSSISGTSPVALITSETALSNGPGCDIQELFVFASGATPSISKSPSFCVLCFLKEMNVN